MSITKPIDSTASSSSSFEAPSVVHIDLPSDVVGLFFSFLNQIQDRINLGLTSKDFRAVYLQVSPRALAFHQLFPILEKPAKELLEITQQRELTPEEQEYDECKITVWEEAGHDSDEELENIPTEAAQVQTLIPESEEALSVFFKIFETGLNSLKISPLDEESFRHYEWIPKRLICGLANQTSDNVIFHIKVGTVDKDLTDLFFKFMVEAYANQPIDKITRESFDNYYDELIKKGQSLPIMNIFYYVKIGLVAAIKAKHDAQEIDRVKNEFLNTDVNNPRFIKMKEALFADLYTEKTRLQAELDELRGTNGFNGTIDKAWRDYQQAITDAKVFFSRSDMFMSVEEGISRLLGALQVGVLQDDTPLSIMGNLEKKYNIYQPLVTRLNYLAEYKPGTDVRIGGRIFEIETIELTSEFLDQKTREKMAEAALFYEELNTTPFEEEKEL